ncbi:MAG: nitrogen regulatory protein P-II family [Bacteroidetes bacterium HLUCCA01]|nr:MAG: nitrogen regulatory protein P-II family [Bacteroidetes bacterium HLUCCA01]
MELVKAKLITIITERLLRHEITDMIKLKGATGYTRSEVEGEGSRGIRASDFEGRNVKIETIVSESVADAIMQEVSENYFENYAVIAYVRDVEVARGAKYLRR